MCTLSQDDTQSPINPAAAIAPQDKWKPPPNPELPATPTQEQSHSRLARAMHIERDQHSLFSIIAIPEPSAAGAEDVPSEMMSAEQTCSALLMEITDG